jgi:hypothetical protein
MRRLRASADRTEAAMAVFAQWSRAEPGFQHKMRPRCTGDAETGEIRLWKLAAKRFS